MAGSVDWERYLPRVERRTGWWFAGILALQAVVQALFLAWGGPALSGWLSLPPGLAGQIVYHGLAPAIAASLMVLVLWLSVGRLGAPDAVVGLMLIERGLSTAEALLQVPFATVTATAVRVLTPASPYLRPELSATLGSVQRALNPAVSFLAVALFAYARAGAGAGSRAERVLSGAGLGIGADPLDRRMAIFFAVVPFAVSVAILPFSALGLAAYLVTSAPPEAPPLAAEILNAGVGLFGAAILFAALYLSIRRLDAPRSLWLAFAAPWVGFVVFPASTLISGAGSQAEGLVPSALFQIGEMMLFGAVALVFLLFTTHLATRGLSAKVPPEGEADDETPPAP